MKEVIELTVNETGFFANSRKFDDLNEAIAFESSMPKNLRAKLVRYMTKRDEQGNPSFEFAILVVRGSLSANKRAGVANETSIKRLRRLVALDNVTIELKQGAYDPQFNTIDDMINAVQKVGA
jgi:hypothetical protein